MRRASARPTPTPSNASTPCSTARRFARAGVRGPPVCRPYAAVMQSGDSEPVRLALLPAEESLKFHAVGPGVTRVRGQSVGEEPARV
jgi:hypothetical protein